MPTNYVNPNKAFQENVGQAPISVQGLSNPQQPLNIPQAPLPTPAQPLIDNSLESLMAAFNAPTETEKQSSDIQGQLLASIEKLGTKKARAGELEAQVGLPQQRNDLQNIMNQLQGLQKEALAIPLQIQQDAEGRGVTAGGVAPIEAGKLRTNAIKSLGLAAIGQTLQGNIALAESTVARAIEYEFEPEQTRLTMLEKIYDMNQDALAREDSKRSTTFQALLNERSRLLEVQKAELEQKKADKKEIFDIGLIAQRYGADSMTVQKIFSAKSREDAVAAAGQYMVDPKAKYELESARLDNKLKQAQLNRTIKETSLLGKQTATESKAEAAALKEANSSIPVMQDKITLIDALSKHKGLTGSVGAYKVARFTPFSIDKAAKQEFAGGIHKLVGGLTLDNLIAAKARGATFGALSEGELRILANSATAITDWEVKDDNGKGTGVWAIDQSSFKRELDTIKQYTQRALTQSQGTVFDEEEAALFGDLFNSTTSSTPQSYY